MSLCAYIVKVKGRSAGVLLVILLSLFPLLPFTENGDTRQVDKKTVRAEKATDIYYKTEGIVSGPLAPQLSFPNDYGPLAFQNQLIIWVSIQQHFFFASFVFGTPIVCLILELVGHLTRKRRPEMAKKYDTVAHEVTKIGFAAYTMASLLGGVLVVSLLTLYGGFFTYILSLFRPVLHIYALCFILESGLLYLYYYQWEAMNDGGELKWLHLTLVSLLNFTGMMLMYLANAVAAFMMSPAGVDQEGRYLGNIWKVLHTPLSHPIGVHRIFAGAMLSGGVTAAYAAYRFLASDTDEERAYYDWMGYITIFIAIGSLIPMPFAGYWLARTVFSYRQQMGVTLMGGLLSWLFVIQATMIGALFIAADYYLWQGMHRMHRSGRYLRWVKYMIPVLAVCFLIWMTPHTVVMSPAELKAMGGAQHPVVGNYGVMSAKNGAINTIIAVTVLNFILYSRSNKLITVKWAKYGNIALFWIFVWGFFNIIWLSIYGYYIPANVRIGLSSPQAISTLSILCIGTALNVAMLKGARPYGPIEWGKLSVRGAYALMMLALSFTWTMALMGYIRSSVRLHWHVNEIMRDNSPWAFLHPIGYVATVICVNVTIFWTLILFVFWVSSLSKSPVPALTKGEVTVQSEYG